MYKSYQYFPFGICRVWLAKREADDKLLKRVICLLLIFAISYALLRIIKNSFHRPGYRLTLQGVGTQYGVDALWN